MSDAKPRVRIRDGKPLFSTVEKRVNPELVIHLESMLEQAQSGEMRSMVEVCEWDDGRVDAGHCLHSYADVSRLMAAMFTLLTSLAFSRTRHADELYDPSDCVDPY